MSELLPRVLNSMCPPFFRSSTIWLALVVYRSTSALSSGNSASGSFLHIPNFLRSRLNAFCAVWNSWAVCSICSPLHTRPHVSRGSHTPVLPFCRGTGSRQRLWTSLPSFTASQSSRIICCQGCGRMPYLLAICTANLPSVSSYSIACLWVGSWFPTLGICQNLVGLAQYLGERRVLLGLRV